jgi:hypothetical protein
MANATSILTPDLTLPPLTGHEAKEAPHTTKWLQRMMLALRKRHNDIATAVATVTLSGATTANLPPPGTPGRLFYVTSTHTLYGDDGTVWTAV